eukprot:scaffold100674_cov46-Prasinocladus_malaysianus.AAC.1
MTPSKQMSGKVHRCCTANMLVVELAFRKRQMPAAAARDVIWMAVPSVITGSLSVLSIQVPRAGENSA